MDPIETSPTGPEGVPANRQAVTRLLSAWRSGDEAALQQLTPLVYDQLRQLARRFMRREREGHTLQATAVVHEAFVRLVDMEVNWQDRGHFYAIASRLMRRILVDHAKAKRRSKRGGDVLIRPLESLEDVEAIPATTSDINILEIDDALERLGQHEPRLAQTVELHYFGGLTYQEVAETLQVSETTVHRDMRLAKAWMLSQIRESDPADESDRNKEK
jgi:RNA polymerase sigma factor (TIGR02999 family)